MKRNRITLAFLTCFLVFLFVGMYAQPVYAAKLTAKSAGITVSKPTRSYDSETGKYSMKITLKNQGEYQVGIMAYLYDAEGEQLMRWSNKGTCYYVSSDEEKTLKFGADYSKYKSSSYTFVYKVKVFSFYNPNKNVYEDTVFTWKWTITSEESCPGMKFKKQTLQNLDDGRIVTRINFYCKNMKGQTVNIYVYDENGDIAFKCGGKNKRKSNSENAWFTWSGEEGGQQYQDGYYTVKVVSSGGQSIKKKFYFDFPYDNN